MEDLVPLQVVANKLCSIWSYQLKKEHFLAPMSSVINVTVKSIYMGMWWLLEGQAVWLGRGHLGFGAHHHFYTGLSPCLPDGLRQ